MSTGRSVLDALIALLFPDRCAGCSRLGQLLCPRCRAAFVPYPHPVRQLPPALAGVQIAFVFDGPLRSALHRLKYRSERRLAQPLGAMLAAALKLELPAVDVVLPIPLHADRLSARGFNQAEALARSAASQLALPLQSQIVRIRKTEQQAHLDARARQANVRGAFRWEGGDPVPRRVLLIDDVLTTGATMSACAQALLEAGSEVVYGAALARSRPELDRQLSMQP